MMHCPIDIRHFGVWTDDALQTGQFILYSDWAAGWKIRGSIHDRGQDIFLFYFQNRRTGSEAYPDPNEWSPDV